MPMTTPQFVAACRITRNALKYRAVQKKVDTGIKTAKKFDPKQTMVGAAHKELLKERNRMAKVLAQASKIKKAKSITLTKIFIDEYEKALRFAVQKHGPDPKNKEVRKQLDALRAHLKALNKDYGGEVVALTQALKAQRGDVKIARALAKAWGKYAKAFMTLAVAAGTNPAASMKSVSYWGNMEQCNFIAKQMMELAQFFAIGVRILEDAEAKASDHFYFINQHITYSHDKNYLKNL